MTTPEERFDAFEKKVKQIWADDCGDHDRLGLGDPETETPYLVAYLDEVRENDFGGDDIEAERGTTFAHQIGSDFLHLAEHLETEPIDPHLVLLMEVADGLESALKHITKDGMTDENEELYHLGIAAIDNARDYLKAHEAGRKN
jgi:hypothetical protein